MALSPGCADCAAQGVFPGLPSGLGGAGQFAAGERLTVSGGPPDDGPYPGDMVRLSVDLATAETLMYGDPGTVVDCAAYPGTVGYTFLADGLYSWMCEMGPNGTISVNCGVAPPFDPVQEITNLKARVAGLTIASGVTGPLIYDLDEALKALGGQVVTGRGWFVRNRGLAFLRRSSTAARFLAWAGPDPCRSLQTFIDRATSAWVAGQLTNAQACELTSTAKNIRRFLNCGAGAPASPPRTSTPGAP
jgi:hypothetical protein